MNPVPSLERARIAIIGAGPTGLGAALRLGELGLRNSVVFEKESEYYPTPSLTRDTALDCLLPELEFLHIFSRGRFGAGKYTRITH